VFPPIAGISFPPLPHYSRTAAGNPILSLFFSPTSPVKGEGKRKKESRDRERKRVEELSLFVVSEIFNRESKGFY